MRKSAPARLWCYPDHAPVTELFAYCGDAIPVADESVFEQGSVHACVYSWFFALYEELIQATESPALPRELSARLVMGMARGAAELALAKPDIDTGTNCRRDRHRRHLFEARTRFDQAAKKPSMPGKIGLRIAQRKSSNPDDG